MTHNYGKFDQLIQLEGDHESTIEPFGDQVKFVVTTREKEITTQSEVLDCKFSLTRP